MLPVRASRAKPFMPFSEPPGYLPDKATTIAGFLVEKPFVATENAVSLQITVRSCTPKCILRCMTPEVVRSRFSDAIGVRFSRRDVIKSKKPAVSGWPSRTSMAGGPLGPACALVGWLFRQQAQRAAW
jgi:hypothetical protein